MVGIASIAFFALGASAGIVPRALPQVLTDLQLTDNDIKNLSNQVANFDGNVKSWAPQQQKINTILADLKLTTSDANNSPQGSASDSQSIVNFLNNPLGPDVTTLVNNYINQKQKYINAGLKSVNRLDAQYLRGNTTNVANAVIPKLASSAQASASAAFNKIDYDWARLVSAYT